MSLKDLAEKHDYKPSYDRIRHYANIENWTAQKKAYQLIKYQQTAREARVEVNSTEVDTTVRQAALGQSLQGLSATRVQALLANPELIKDLTIAETVLLARVGTDIERKALGIDADRKKVDDKVASAINYAIDQLAVEFKYEQGYFKRAVSAIMRGASAVADVESTVNDDASTLAN